MNKSDKQPNKKAAESPQPEPEEVQTEEGSLQVRLDEATADLQRVRADFENYRKRAEVEKESARKNGQAAAALKLLPVVDVIERAIAHTPEDIADHQWVQGIVKITKKLDSALSSLELERIDASVGALFDPELHEAVQFDTESEGELEVIAEELQPGYRLDGEVVRPAMVRVTRK